MIRHADLLCRDDTRRRRIIASPTLQGIDYLEVVTEPAADEQRVLLLYFLPQQAAHQPALVALLDTIAANHAALVRIEGGVRIRQIAIQEVTREGDHLRIRVDRPGDFSDYTLTVQPPLAANPGDPALDPAYASIEFNFKAACPSQFDCRGAGACVSEPAPPAAIDYLAKDYASFRQALLDRITEINPEWKERSPADLGIALVELLAYAGDHLSYYQDAVANEAYLETARQRISVRRHARLIDYRMHDGASAAAFVHFVVSAPLTLKPGQAILSRISEPLTGSAPPGTVIGAGLRDQALRSAAAIYETRGEFHLHPDVNELPIHDWRRQNCCLPAGSTTADLVGDWTARLKPGDLLLLEETRSPSTGRTEDADESHRQVVLLTHVEPARDPLDAVPLTRVRWDAADALRFPLCVRTAGAADAVAVARGNLVVAWHGRTVVERHPAPPSEGIRPGRRPYRFRLRQGPLGYRARPEPGAPVAHAMGLAAREAEPEVLALTVTKGAEVLDGWTARPDLLSSGPDDLHFVVETDNFGRAQIRFGDGIAGKAPPEEAKIDVAYRVGAGTAGTVAAGALSHVLQPDGATDLTAVDSVRNPQPSWGAEDPEPIEVVKLTAPAALRSGLERAVTEDDYARVAERSPDVSKAVATFMWTGSWHTVSLTIDPRGSTVLTPEQSARILSLVRRYSQLGYDLRIEQPVFVPLAIGMEVCVDAGHFRGNVEAALAIELSNRVLTGGKPGFFHPDRFTFGQTLYASQVYAAVVSVEGVASAVVTRFGRQGSDSTDELEKGSITPGRREILRLDNDPNFPENGVLRLWMRGGK